MSDVLINYDSKRVPVSGTGPSPYVSLSEDVLTYGDKWGLVHRISLNGQITGCTFQDLYDAQTGLAGVFENSYKTLEVKESADDQNNYSTVFSFSGCSVDGISFSNASYNKVVGYSVELTAYPSGYTGFFSGTYGVLDPVDNISISEGEDGFATLSRQVSARGFVSTTIDDAINNAKNYVNSRTGVSYIKSAPQISGFENSANFNPILVSVNENLDRLSLTYSIEQSYIFSMVTGDNESAVDYSFNNSYLTRYSTNLNSGAGRDFVTADIQGEIKAGITGVTGAALSGALVEKLSELNPYAIISGKYGTPNGFDFCKEPLTFSVTQNSKTKSINFNASYDNLDLYSYVDSKYVHDETFLDANISHTTNELTKVTNVNIRGEIKSRGSTTNRYNKNLSYLGHLLNNVDSATGVRLFNFVNDYYNEFFNSGSAPKFALNKQPSSLVVNADPILGTISINAAFDNKDRFGDLASTEYDINYLPYNTVYSYGFSCNDALKHIAVDSNVTKREKASIRLSLADQDKSADDLITGLYNFTSGNFYDQFIVPLAIPNSDQQEQSTLSTNNSTFTDGGEYNKQNANASLNEAYSFDLKDSLLSNRRVIKSTK